MYEIKKTSQKKEEVINQTEDKIMNLLIRLTPKTKPQTIEECQALQNDPDIEEKLNIVSSLLQEFNLHSASSDLKISNIKRYALWILHHAKQNIKLTNPITRAVYIDQRAICDYQQIREHLRSLELLPEAHPLLKSEFE